MESLNIYTSDGDSDFSPSKVVTRKFVGNSEEVDANCEPITMDMSEDSSEEHSDHGADGRRDALRTKRQYSKSLSPSPATSYSSDSSESNKRSKIRDDVSKTDSSKDKRYNEDRRDDDKRSKYDKDYRREDDDRDRRRREDDDGDRKRRDDGRDRRRDRDNDRYTSKNYERKRYRSRSRSSSRSGHKSYRSKRSRSRSRSHDRYHRRGSPIRNSGRRRSPYRSRRSRSKSRDKPRPKNWKSTSKLKVLEKLGIELKVPPTIEAPIAGSNQTITNTSSQLTPQMLLQKTIEEQVEKVKSATGIALPSYYNPMAVNPTKYAEQIQKRRLLWGNKEKQTNDALPQESKTTNAPVATAENKVGGTIWQGAKFGGDQDGRMTAKFQRLMGIKNPSAAAVPEIKKEGTDLIKKQEELFNSMESQYEVARLATHTHRGVGLGFGTFQPR